MSAMIDRFAKRFRELLDREEQLEKEQEEDEAQQLSVEPQPEEKPDDTAERMRLMVQNGALLRVWQKWAGSEPPPILSMAGKEEKELPIEQSKLVQERIRLSARLEQDAKKRIKDIDEADKGNRSLDAVCRAYVSRDGLVGWLFMFPPLREGEDIHFDSIARALQESKITSGMDSTEIAAMFREKDYFQLRPVAFGTPPIEGEDGRIVECFPRTAPMTIKIDENGDADYRSTSYIQLIRKGDILCDIIQPKEGQPGLKVDGSTIEPKRVKEAALPSGINTTVSEDGLHLIATRDGHLEYSGGKFHVKPMLEVRGDVDYSSGNIDFRGDVHIYGDVRENFSVRATGTVTIDGLVEAANIEAGGDLVVSCGVTGDNQAVIKSRGRVRAKYLENCVVYGEKGVFADCIMTSQVYSDDNVEVLTGRGTIIGGTMSAAHQVKAKIIGSQAGRLTEIRLGEFAVMKEELRTTEIELQTVRQESQELEKQINYLESQQGKATTAEKLAKSHLQRSVLAMKEKKLLKRREELETTTPDFSKCRLECAVVYPVTKLTIRSATWTTEHLRSRLAATYDLEQMDIKII